MKTSYIGMILILIGVLAFLSGIGLDINFCGLFFAILLLWFGVRLLVMSNRDTDMSKRKSFMVPSENAGRARIAINHGMGKLIVNTATIDSALVEGRCSEEVQPTAEQRGDEVAVNIGTIENAWIQALIPWQWHPFNWDLGLNPHVPTELSVDSGMSEIHLDLSQLQLSKLSMNYGMGAAHVTLPAAAGHTSARFKTGMSSLKIRVPAGVAARIHIDGFGDADVDKHRFPPMGDYYQSPDYDTASNKVDIKVDYGMGSVEIV